MTSEQFRCQEIERVLRERFDVAPEDAARIAPKVQEVVESYAYMKIGENILKKWMLRAKIKEFIGEGK